MAKMRMAALACAGALVVGLGVWALAGGSRTPGASAGARDADCINVFPVAGAPGNYLVNPAFARIGAVHVVQDGVPNPRGPRPKVDEIPAGHWRYDRAQSRLVVDQAVDDARCMVTASGDFAYPLVFRVDAGVEPESIRVLVDGAVGREGAGYRFDGQAGTLTLTAAKSPGSWFAVVYSTADGGFSIGSMAADRLNRAQRSHLGLPLEGNCVAQGREGRSYRSESAGADGPWMVELLPRIDGETGVVLWPDDYRWDRAAGTLVFAKPVDPKRFAVFAHYWVAGT